MPRKRLQTTLFSAVSPVKEEVREETKRQRFERIGRARTNKALTTIRLLGNLSSENYEWDERDVRAMTDTLQYAVNETLAKFQLRQKNPPLRFSFPSNGKAQKQHAAG